MMLLQCSEKTCIYDKGQLKAITVVDLSRKELLFMSYKYYKLMLSDIVNMVGILMKPANGKVDFLGACDSRLQVTKTLVLLCQTQIKCKRGSYVFAVTVFPPRVPYCLPSVISFRCSADNNQ